MREDRVLLVADLLRKGEAGSFAMHSISKRYKGCETPQCIMGWTLWAKHLEHGDDYEELTEDVNSIVTCEEYLEIDESASQKLFFPDADTCWYAAGRRQHGFIGKKHALRCLGKLAETGEVDWEGTRGAKQ